MQRMRRSVELPSRALLVSTRQLSTTRTETNTRALRLSAAAGKGGEAANPTPIRKARSRLAFPGLPPAGGSVEVRGCTNPCHSSLRAVGGEGKTRAIAGGYESEKTTLSELRRQDGVAVSDARRPSWKGREFCLGWLSDLRCGSGSPNQQRRAPSRVRVAFALVRLVTR